MLQYQNEDIFFAYITGKVEYAPYPRLYVRHPWFHFLCAKHRCCGLKVENTYFKSDSLRCNWFKMELKNFPKDEQLLHFILHSSVYSTESARVSFDIKVVSTIGNYYYEMMDDSWMDDFWTAATDQDFTDVEIFVGTVKVMEAHRVILSARSPVMNEAFNKISDTGKSVLTFDVKFNDDIVKNFLKFLYTGSLESSASNKQLLELATQYKVETLKNVCQLADHVPDVEKFTNSVLQLA